MRNATKLQLSIVIAGLVFACTAPNVSAPTPDDHVLGPATARITLIEYGDYQCPPCSVSSRDIDRILAAHPNVRFVYRHHPSRAYRNAMMAARAAEAAERQGKFWEMHRLLFAKQAEWYGTSSPEDLFRRYARALRLDDDAFVGGLRSDVLRQRIVRAFDDGRYVGVSGTPAFFLDGKRLVPAPLTYEALDAQIDHRLLELGLKPHELHGGRPVQR